MGRRHAEALARKGTALAACGDEAAAEEALRGATAAAPSSLFARLELARFLAVRAPDESMALAESLVAAQPKASSSRLLLARLQLETGRYEEAANLARQLQRGPTRVEAATLLGEAELARGRLDAAQRALESVRSEASAHRARVFLGRPSRS